ncbi:MAG: hypothetical protein GQE15_31235 [Archangiaceae bacterium]|nr:hypothetical protein [Archangiaceae bacterium]
MSTSSRWLLAMCLACAACKPTPVSVMVEKATLSGDAIHVVLSMRDKNGEALAVSGTMTGQVVDAMGAVQCTGSAAVEENVVRLHPEKLVVVELPVKCPPAERNRKVRLAFTPESGRPLEVMVTLDEEAARRANEPKATDAKVQPAE